MKSEAGRPVGCSLLCFFENSLLHAESISEYSSFENYSLGILVGFFAVPNMVF